jgi:hypothetical protein
MAALPLDSTLAAQARELEALEAWRKAEELMEKIGPRLASRARTAGESGRR